jgi:hypothetical protein
MSPHHSCQASDRLFSLPHDESAASTDSQGCGRVSEPPFDLNLADVDIKLARLSSLQVDSFLTSIVPNVGATLRHGHGYCFGRRR